MSFKAWAKLNAPKAYEPPKQLLKSTGPVLTIKTEPTLTEFQPGDHIHYISTARGLRYGRFVRYEGEYAYANFGNTPQESESNTIAFPTYRSNIRSGWPDNPRSREVERVTLADEFDE